MSSHNEQNDVEPLLKSHQLQQGCESPQNPDTMIESLQDTPKHSCQCRISIYLFIILMITTCIIGIYIGSRFSTGNMHLKSNISTNDKEELYMNTSSDATVQVAMNRDSEITHIEELPIVTGNSIRFSGLIRLLPSDNFPPVTESTLRRSRSQVGNLRKFRKVIQKLKNKQCLNVLIIGGSVSVGVGLNSGEKSWHQNLNDWFNQIYACHGKHRFRNKAVGGTGSDYVISHFHEKILKDPTDIAVGILHYDIIMVDYVENDLELAKSPDIVKKYEILGNVDDAIAFYSEVLIRSLLKLPYKPLVMYIGVGWRNDNLNHNPNKLYHTTNIIPIPPFFSTAEWGHNKILLYYQIPAVSVLQSLIGKYVYDIHTKGMTRPNWMIDPWHPNADGHKFIALLVAYQFLSEEKIMTIYEAELQLEPNPNGRLPPAWFLNDKDIEKYEQLIDKPLSMLNFMNFEDTNIYFQHGWEHKSETQKHKWGMIATEANANLIIPVKIQKYLNIGFLRTYTNIGTAAVWIDGNSSLDDDCSETLRTMQLINISENKLKLTRKEYFVLNGLWNDHHSLSQYQIIEIESAGVVKENLFVHFCLPQNRKFKLLSISTF